MKPELRSESTISLMMEAYSFDRCHLFTCFTEFESQLQIVVYLLVLLFEVLMRSPYWPQ